MTSELEQIGPDIWIAEGPSISFYGIPFPTRMTVVRLAGGDLFLHSPIRCTPELQAAVEALGPIRHLVSPNWIHYAYLSEWAGAQTVTWASPGVRKRAASRGAEITFDADLEDTPPPDWAGEIDQMVVHGSRAHVEVVFFHRASKTLILTDLIENMSAGSLPFWVRPLARLGGVIAPKGRIPLDIYLSFSRDKLRKAVQRMLDWQPETVVLAHGEIFRENARSRLREGFRNVIPA